ncbi:MAG: radical SAM protein [bacterium]
MIDNSVLIPGKCDLRCLFCLPPGLEPPDVDTSIEKIIQRVREIRDAGSEEVFLGIGGFEPTTYPDIIKVIEYCRSIGFSTIT